ncbi:MULTISPECIES: Rpn family recombination-promoting nuclease/putative transposase [Methanocalculus]|uniref:Rpn family recombination-promoting nuclease/putative transposase n=1 Tax=Methanocalculus TaxID=71151 RepID=UPI0021114C56|nr:Rpn family recombination-promoting nuclease/putative transposase [Methanocalculus sp. AMF5]
MKLIGVSEAETASWYVFSHKEMMADLISGFLNEEFASACDFSTLKRCNGSYVTDDLREREDAIRVVRKSARDRMIRKKSARDRIRTGEHLRD